MCLTYIKEKSTSRLNRIDPVTHELVRIDLPRIVRRENIRFHRITERLDASLLNDTSIIKNKIIEGSINSNTVLSNITKLNLVECKFESLFEINKDMFGKLRFFNMKKCIIPYGLFVTSDMNKLISISVTETKLESFNINTKLDRLNNLQLIDNSMSKLSLCELNIISLTILENGLYKPDIVSLPNLKLLKVDNLVTFLQEFIDSLKNKDIKVSLITNDLLDCTKLNR